jgi:hypothetical protein
LAESSAGCVEAGSLPGQAMNVAEQAAFAEAIAEAENLIARTEAVIQRAKSQCHGEVYEDVDVIAKRTFELRVRCEWLRLVVLGVIEPSTSADAKERQGADRRNAIDRRVSGMRKQLLAHAAKVQKE